jgi:large subunit ribosomal protein L29
MELAKIRSLSDPELAHQEKVDAEQLFRLRFQVALGQNDGVKKIRQLRREIAQIKTVARERELGVHGESKDAKASAQPAKAEEVAPAETGAVKAEEAAPAAAKKTRKATKKAASDAETKTTKAKGARK